MTPAAELRAAAAKLREMADRTIGGPWYTVGLPWNDRTLYVIAGDEDPHRGMYVADVEHPTLERSGTENANAEWIALANPAIAEPLAAWLEDCAGQAESMPGPGRFGTCDEPGSVQHALAVARAINPGGAS